jgi:hypothetical protein
MLTGLVGGFAANFIIKENAVKINILLSTDPC